MENIQNKNNNNKNRPPNPNRGGRFNQRKKKRFPRPPRKNQAKPATAEILAGRHGEDDTLVTLREPAMSAPAQSPESGSPQQTIRARANKKYPDLSLFDDPPPLKELSADDPDAVEVIGVKFKQTGKVYYFAPGDISVAREDAVIVETARGPEYGEVFFANRYVPSKDIVLPLRPLIRIATKEDSEHHEQNRKKEKEAFAICLEKIAKHGLDMKLVEAQYAFDNSKLLFYFTSAGRVDFRELVKDLASVFRTRIELRQIGIRDEAKLLGGLGACGRALCCSTFLSDFMQVSIKMAKEQNLSLNSNKISGSCGRLMCCLRYEHDTYVDEIRQTPPVDSLVRTVEGDGTVIEINPLAGAVKVRLSGKPDIMPKLYHRDDVKVLSRPEGGERDRSKNEAEIE